MVTIQIEVRDITTILLTQEKKKGLGSSQEIKFQGPEETKRRVKEVNQVDSDK